MAKYEVRFIDSRGKSCRITTTKPDELIAALKYHGVGREMKVAPVAQSAEAADLKSVK